MMIGKTWPFAVLAGISILLSAGCSRPNGKPEEKPAGLPVEAAAVKTAEMQRSVLLTGSIKPKEDTSIAVTFSARVLAVTVREGDRVQAGQVLIRLDSTDAEARLQQARALLVEAKNRLAILKAGARSQERAVAKNAVVSAKSTLDKAALDLQRLEGLYQQGAVAKEQLDSARTYHEVAKAQYESALEQSNLVEAGARTEEIEAAAAAVRQAQAAVALAANDLKNATLRSPISGVVYWRDLNVGDVPAAMGSPVMKVASLDRVYFEAVVPEKDFVSLSVGQPVAITVDALPGQAFPGEVERLVPVARDQSRDFLARIAVDNGQLRLKPGMFARGEVLVEKHPQAVVVPRDAVIEQGSEKSLFVVKNNLVQHKKVVTGLESPALIEILSGVSPGEEVVTAGQQGLKSGSLVSVTRRQPGE